MDSDGRLLEPKLFNWRTCGASPTLTSSAKVAAAARPATAASSKARPRAAATLGKLSELTADSDWPMVVETLETFGVKVTGGAEDPAGSSLVAVRPFEPGDEILREAPLASVRFDEPWSALEVALTSQFQLSKIAPAYRLLARMLESDGSSLLRGEFVQSMAANMEVAESAWNQRFCAFLADAVNEGEGEPRTSAAMVTKLLAILKTNAFGLYEVGEAGLSSVGLGLYPLVALANHECDPSAVWSFEGEQIVLRAVRTLRPGEAVTDAYVLPREPPASRQQKLRESYRFDCACARCVREAADAPKLSKLAAEFRTARAALEGRIGLEGVTGTGGAGYAGEEDMEDMVLLKRCTKLLGKLTPPADCHPDTAVLRLKLGSLWWRLYERGQQAESARGGAAAKFPIANGCLQQATEHWKHAREMVVVSLGSSHELLATIDEKLGRASKHQPPGRDAR